MIEPKRGRVSVFTSGSENLHHVEKVSSGTRLIFIFIDGLNLKFNIFFYFQIRYYNIIYMQREIRHQKARPNSPPNQPSGLDLLLYLTEHNSQLHLSLSISISLQPKQVFPLAFIAPFKTTNKHQLHLIQPHTAT